MIDWKVDTDRPGLLVSVRNEAEAMTAEMAGADVIDVKEPSRGSLGAADEKVLASVVQAMRRRAPVTAALGELVDIVRTPGLVERELPTGISLFKIGLAGCAKIPDWTAKWRDAITKLQISPNRSKRHPVAVVYADWNAADAPAPEVVLRAATTLRCPALLVDTWDKSAGTLFDHWSIESVRTFMDSVRAKHIKVVLAGSLAGKGFLKAVALRPDLVAVRSAACDSGRSGQVTEKRVRELKETIEAFHKATAVSMEE